VTAIAVLFVFLFGASASYASSSKAHHRIVYSTQLGHDLDGDHLPETATIRRGGDVYEVSIKFTTGQPKLRLKTYVTSEIAGLAFQTADVNNDNKDDLVITSATSVRPVAVWLNQGHARFQKASPWLYGLGRYRGPTYRVRQHSEPEPVGNVSVDPLPHATLEPKYFTHGEGSVLLLSSIPEQRTCDSLLSEIPPRGPPAITLV
jgi:hypothetical protein